MRDYAAPCKEEITQEHLKDAHSERIRFYKMQFMSMEKKRNTELKTGLPHFTKFVFWHVNA